MAGYIGSRLSNSVVSLDGVTIGSATKFQPFIGSIAAFAMSSAPSGWLVCNGAEYAIADYGDLYGVISTTWGALTDGAGNSGTTHFVVPDLQGAFLRGSGNGTINARTKAGGSVGSLVEDQTQKITGSGYNSWFGNTTNRVGSLPDEVYGAIGKDNTGRGSYELSGATNGFGNAQSGITFNSSNSPDARTSSTTDGETFPYNASVQYCIKY